MKFGNLMDELWFNEMFMFSSFLIPTVIKRLTISYSSKIYNNWTNFHTEKINKFYNLLRKYLRKGLRRKLC